ncbi:hypothetical protein SLEP1_g6865 [Rubroshorea leprosula]|uniref:Threonylcarbamoyl-AMP synthase n=1 Tax=Rubroshorea leprosula TaxID=152421 RepID=A0AAV5HWX4_9ROSI|nr:hypothetical protein SLEP1_g6865 [Rubroshorea leprosula]
MAEAVLCGEKSTQFLSFLRSLAAPQPGAAPCFCRVRFVTSKPAPLRVLAMSVKRSPKRLKYSAPRFTKEDSLLYVEADPSGAGNWKLEPVIQLLKEGAVGVIPTDTVYAIVCHLKSDSAIEHIRSLLVSYVALFETLTHTMGFPGGDGQGHANIFRVVKRCLPGPYTFILTASKALPKQCIRYGTTTAKYASRKNVGVRIPDDPICQAILEKMDAPLICTRLVL